MQDGGGAPGHDGPEMEEKRGSEISFPIRGAEPMA